MALAGRQIRQLRSLAHHLEPVVIVGKSCVTENTVEQANEYIEKHELIKCSVLDTCAQTPHEAAEDLAEALGAEVVQVIGRKFTLYRETSREGVEKIQLD
ncbi:ribosome assembly RNA-binding protein YhbY [Paratractidigestivibacter sp.]|uniref:ribosome assembly RNA-binding protein YhbY n=1 Tax=Paratractidigestivibacter sp. TaxID=2847316 RepID=UPI002ABDEAED|nr:ribosome assembly RNA-binding protein YhbY [Paratractidigestivibacter sp.]